jgi:hypothetical protein
MYISMKERPPVALDRPAISSRLKVENNIKITKLDRLFESTTGITFIYFNFSRLGLFFERNRTTTLSLGFFCFSLLRRNDAL